MVFAGLTSDAVSDSLRTLRPSTLSKVLNERAFREFSQFELGVYLWLLGVWGLRRTARRLARAGPNLASTHSPAQMRSMLLWSHFRWTFTSTLSTVRRVPSSAAPSLFPRDLCLSVCGRLAVDGAVSL